MSYLTGGRGREARWPYVLIAAGVLVGMWTVIAAVVWWLAS